MAELGKDQKVTREVAESMVPTQGYASNDGLVINAIQQMQKDIGSTNSVKSEINRTTSFMEKLKSLFTNVNLSEASADLAQDKQTLEILGKKNVAQNLLAGEAVQAKYVSVDNNGKPRHFYGMKILQLNNNVETQQPILKLGFVAAHALQKSNLKINKPEQLPAHEIKLVNYGGYHETIKDYLGTRSTLGEGIDKILLQKNSSDLDKAMQIKKYINQTSKQIPFHPITAERHFDDIKDFKEELGNKFKVRIILPRFLKDASDKSNLKQIGSEEWGVPISRLPISHKKNPFSEQQVTQLLLGKNVKVSDTQSLEFKNQKLSTIISEVKAPELPSLKLQNSNAMDTAKSTGKKMRF